MALEVQIPDAPYRIGTSGKYKLLVKDAIPKYGGYEYIMVDADGKEYKATHAKHYAPKQILRCMVHFSVAKATLVVTETVICSKQDSASPLSEANLPSSSKQSITLGDPIKEKRSGIYRLRVVSLEKKDKGFIYRLEDSAGRRYEARSRHLYQIGFTVNCEVSVQITHAGLKTAIKSIGIHANSHIKRHKKSGGNSSDWLPAPAKGDYFHLIYTPMGNKR